MKELILDYLMKSPYEGKTPTQIDLALGKDYTIASSSVSKGLKSLLRDGKVIRYTDDRKVKYSVNRYIAP